MIMGNIINIVVIDRPVTKPVHNTQYMYKLMIPVYLHGNNAATNGDNTKITLITGPGVVSISLYEYHDTTCTCTTQGTCTTMLYGWSY